MFLFKHAPGDMNIGGPTRLEPRFSDANALPYATVYVQENTGFSGCVSLGPEPNLPIYDMMRC